MAWKKRHITFKRVTVRWTFDFVTEMIKARRTMEWFSIIPGKKIFKWINNGQPGILNLEKISPQN